jgi:two-component system, chemotaxis family, protein-glutamate methylesterase/glutaminase
MFRTPKSPGRRLPVEEKIVAGKDIVVIGTSTGGIEALQTLLGGIPADFRGSVFIVMHTSADSPALLADILDHATPLVVRYASDGERIEPGRVYVAPPDHHLLIEPGRVKTSRGPKENRFRPAVDPLFRSAAQVYGPRAVGVILTGGLDDGTSGLWTIKQLGGTAVVQEPREAIAPSMPQSALQNVHVDLRLPVAQIGPELARLATMHADDVEGVAPMKSLEVEVSIAKADHALDSGVMSLGDPSAFACPECHGVLLEIAEANRMRYRCHTGHSYTFDALLADIDENVEDSLWNTIRALEERVMLMRHMAKHVRDADAGATSAEFNARAEATQRRADVLRSVLLGAAEPKQENAWPPERSERV